MRLHHLCGSRRVKRRTGTASSSAYGAIWRGAWTGKARGAVDAERSPSTSAVTCARSPDRSSLARHALELGCCDG